MKIKKYVFFEKNDIYNNAIIEKGIKGKRLDGFANVEIKGIPHTYNPYEQRDGSIVVVLQPF